MKAAIVLGVCMTVGLLSAPVMSLSYGDCLCYNGNGINIRSTACGPIIGTGKTGMCYTYLGSRSLCKVNGVQYSFLKLRYGSRVAWSAANFMTVSPKSKCQAPVPPRTSGITAKCMSCICKVESNCNLNQGCNWDVNSDSCGPYQIKEAYWIDCGRPGKSWRDCARNKACADGCVRAYMQRYGKTCTGGRTPTCQDYARIHNGGPNGCKYSGTVGYWNKVKSCCGSPTGCN